MSNLRVRDLIEQLQGCDPDAYVLIADEPVIEDDKDIMSGSMQAVASIESGWIFDERCAGASEALETSWDIDFAVQEFGGSVKAVRILGYNSQATNPQHTITYMGAELVRRL